LWINGQRKFMDIGIPMEIKNHEYRVSATPALVRALTRANHRVSVQAGAGGRIGYADADYAAAGAQLVDSAAEAWDNDMVLKVKEPQPAEYGFLRPGQILFTYLHLAAAPDLANVLLERGVTGVAYETVEEEGGHLPLLAPMSEIAGRLSVIAGSVALQMANGGCGKVLGGVPGVTPAKVVVLGGGRVGTEAARMALGLGADVTLLDISLKRLRELDELFGPALKTCYSEPTALAEQVAAADLLIGAVYIPGRRAPMLVTREMVRSMRPGSAIVDVAIDQGGCVETSRPTTHSAPMYIEEGVVHYCVTNMPGACARTATQALTHATRPYVLDLAMGIETLKSNTALRKGLNTFRGHVTHANVAESLKLPFTSPENALQQGN
jgi:alanine dehydrogenase